MASFNRVFFEVAKVEADGSSFVFDEYERFVRLVNAESNIHWIFERTSSKAILSSFDPFGDSSVVGVDGFDFVNNESVRIVGSVAVVDNAFDCFCDSLSYVLFEIYDCRFEFYRVFADSVDEFVVFFSDSATNRELNGLGIVFADAITINLTRADHSVSDAVAVCDSA